MGREERKDVAEVRVETDSILYDASEDENDLEVNYQDVSAILGEDTVLEYQLPVHAISSILYQQLMKLAAKSIRGQRCLLLQNVMLCGIRPAGQPWLLKQCNGSANCGSFDPTGLAGAPCSSL